MIDVLDLVADRFGRCAVCGRREECCELCHRAHDYAWLHPQWSVAQYTPLGAGKIAPAKELARAFQSEVRDESA